MSGSRHLEAARLIEWACRLVRFPSPQTALFERDPQVQAFLSGPVVEVLEECGLGWRRDAMGNLIVEIAGRGDGPSLMLMGYAMTHPANRMERPFDGELIEGGRRLRGRGLAEQKGALVAAIAAAAAVRDTPLRGRLTLAITSAGETGRHDAARAVLDAMDHVPDAAIIAIGTSGRLALANKGRIDVDVRVRGRAAHPSTPWAGIDAIAGARQVLDRVLALHVGTRHHPGLGRATLAATAIRSWPEATHTIQDEVLLTFDRRLLPGDDPQEAFAAIAAAADIGEPWRTETVRGPHMFPAEIAADGPLASAIRQGCLAQGVEPPETFYSNGALDAGLFHSLGREAAMWGPGNMDLWHSDNESISVDEIEYGARGYLGLIHAWCG